jgi:hypothetical protein
MDTMTQVSHLIPYIQGFTRTFLDGVGRVTGGEGGIRTHDTLASIPDFESGAFDRALPPLRNDKTCNSK